MKRALSSRQLLIAAGLMFLATLWWSHPRLNLAWSPPGPTAVEANQQAHAAIQQARAQTRTPPPAPLGDRPVIRLRAGDLFPGPLDEQPHHTPSTRGYPWLVLFDGPLQPEWRQALQDAGATVRAYLPHHALLVEAPAATIRRLAHMPHVAWHGEYRPAYKLQPLLAALLKKTPAIALPVTIQTFAPDDAFAVAAVLRAAQAGEVSATPGKRWGLVRAVVPAGEIAALAARADVQWIEHRPTPRLLNDVARAANRLNVDAAHDDHGLDGAGQIVAVADTGLDSGNLASLHPDFVGQVQQVFDTGRGNDWSDKYYHGTHVIGSLLGTGAASTNQFRGVAPGAQLVLQSVMDASSRLNLPDDLNELYQPAYDAGARLHSDSWGGAAEGEYNSDSMTTDEFVWDHPDLFVAFAAGNEGTDDNRDGVVDEQSLDAPASAKNVLAVGASESGRPAGSGGQTAQNYGMNYPSRFRTEPILSDLISSSPGGGPQGISALSSRGPAMDGRTKPDVVAPGSDVVSARSRASSSTGRGVLSGNTNYCFMTGTSMAAPFATGCATLLRQFCVETRGLENPSAALLKAALAGGARSLSPGQYGTNEFREIPAPPRPNSVEGFGQINLAGTLFPTGATQVALLDSLAPLTTGGSNTLEFIVRESAPLTATLAYSDYPSALAAAVNLVNDLDLALHDPDGAAYFPNGLAEPDRLNNVEGIDLDAPVTGRWTLVVSAHNVPEGPQPYAIYMRGAIDLPAAIEHAPLDNTWQTNVEYTVTARVTSPGQLDPDTVQLHWNTTGSTDDFNVVTMTPGSNQMFSAAIPAQPTDTWVYYYLSAGPADLLTTHPPEAPAALHQFAVTQPLTLTITGAPGEYFAVNPGYGTHTFASGIVVQADAAFSATGTNGMRTACVGWQGVGFVPAAGVANTCEFTITADSSLVWQWQEQALLMHISEPHGILNTNVWHELGSAASSLPAPESALVGQTPYTFAGWLVDGARWPTNGEPSQHQVDGIPMTEPRAATATYLPTEQDSDANGLPDWFELRYFGALGQSRFADPDGDGHENEVEAADHTDPLDSASVPVAPGITHEPLASPVASPAPWLLSAIITDNYRVATATLHWQRNGGLPRSAPMTNSAGDVFTGAIPSPVRTGDSVVYSFSATDVAGFSTQSAAWTVQVAYAQFDFAPTSIVAGLPANTATNLTLQIENSGDLPLVLDIVPVFAGFADDMESGTNDWTRPDGNQDWHISAQDAHSPTRAWYCGREATRTYRELTHAALVSPPIQLAAESRLSFWHHARFENDVDDILDGKHYWDSGVMEISTNLGASWLPLEPDGGYPGRITENPMSPFAAETPCFASTLGWEPVTASLADYAGQMVQIRFRFGADRYVNEEGWRLDDVTVSPNSAATNWFGLSATNLTLTNGYSALVQLQLDTTPLPPMGSAAVALYLHHNDPEQPSPRVLLVQLQNLTRRVDITTSGPGQAVPTGTFLLAPAEPLEVELTAEPNHFIADILTNGVPAPIPNVFTTQTLSWSSLPGNLALHAIFMPLLPDNAVPPEWLAGYNLTTRHWMAEASLDHDGDGLLAWQEYELDSDPLDPESAPLQVNLLAPDEPTNAWRISWHAFTNANATYTVLGSTNLTMGFHALTNILAAPPVMTSPPLPPDHRFFGLQKTLP